MRFRDVRGCASCQSYGDAANPWATVGDIAGGIANPQAAGAAVFAAQQPIQVQGAPINYTPILIGGSCVVLLALVLKRRSAAA